MLTPKAYVDHHCHGVTTDDLQRDAFEALFSESHRPKVPGCTQFDKPIGLLIRRHCAPILDLEPFCAPEQYVERRLELGGAEVNRRLLQATGMTQMLIDTGHRSDDILGVAEMAEASNCLAREVPRIEALMEEAARTSESGGELLAQFCALLEQRSEDAVGLKSIVAYRVTFDIDQTAPGKAEAEAAGDAWVKRNRSEGWGRLEDPTLIRFALFAALDMCVDKKFPLQLHTAVGDCDIDMPKCDPTVFTPFIKAAEDMDVPLTLLHCYPFVRQAGWLAEVFSNVYYDVGFTLNYTGPQARRSLEEALEMGPFFKQLYSSDAFGLAELHYLGRVQFERCFNQVMDDWIAAGDCTTADAERILALIAHQNAERIYRL